MLHSNYMFIINICVVYNKTFTWEGLVTVTINAAYKMNVLWNISQNSCLPKILDVFYVAFLQKASFFCHPEDSSHAFSYSFLYWVLNCSSGSSIIVALKCKGSLVFIRLYAPAGISKTFNLKLLEYIYYVRTVSYFWLPTMLKSYMYLCVKLNIW